MAEVLKVNAVLTNLSHGGNSYDMVPLNLSPDFIELDANRFPFNEEWRAGGMNDQYPSLVEIAWSLVKDKYVVAGCHKLFRAAECFYFQETL